MGPGGADMLSVDPGQLANEANVAQDCASKSQQMRVENTAGSISGKISGGEASSKVTSTAEYLSGELKLIERSLDEYSNNLVDTMKMVENRDMDEAQLYTPGGAPADSGSYAQGGGAGGAGGGSGDTGGADNGSGSAALGDMRNLMGGGAPDPSASGVDGATGTVGPAPMPNVDTPGTPVPMPQAEVTGHPVHMPQAEVTGHPVHMPQAEVTGHPVHMPQAESSSTPVFSSAGMGHSYGAHMSGAEHSYGSLVGSGNADGAAVGPAPMPNVETPGTPAPMPEAEGTGTPAPMPQAENSGNPVFTSHGSVHSVGSSSTSALMPDLGSSSGPAAMPHAEVSGNPVHMPQAEVTGHPVHMPQAESSSTPVFSSAGMGHSYGAHMSGAEHSYGSLVGSGNADGAAVGPAPMPNVETPGTPAPMPEAEGTGTPAPMPHVGNSGDSTRTPATA